MSSRRTFTLATLLLLAAGPGGLWARPEDAPREEPSRRVLRLATGRVEEVPLEAYVASVLPGEIGNAPVAALEAQAVAARSYALARGQRHADEGADLCDGIHCQVYRGSSAATAASRRAALATRGLVLAQQGHVIAAPFHSCCGGRTARPADVWDDEETPELVPVEDDACLHLEGVTWSFRLARTDLPALGSSLGFPEARFLEVYGVDSGGRVSMVRLVAPGGRSRVVRGFDFRRAAGLLWGWSSIRSTAFTVSETRHEYVLVGRGHGHGAGMCQKGAIERARRGESREQILALYYRGASVVPFSQLPPPPPDETATSSLSPERRAGSGGTR